VIPSKKRQSRLAPVSAARPKRATADSARKHHLFVDVTDKEKQLILAYCNSKDLSVSEFLAEVALDDARPSKANSRLKETSPRTVQIELSEHDYAKLVYKSRLRKISPEDFIHTRLLPDLQKSKEWGSLERETLRYYVSDKEHRTLLDHMKKFGHSSRHYVAFLAVQAIEEQFDPIKNKLISKRR
jgi:hypothetical protein